MTTDDYGWGPDPEPLTELQNERAAILEFGDGYSREEAERLAREMHPINKTTLCTNKETNHGDENYTTFHHRNCDGITGSNKPPVSKQGLPEHGQPVLEQNCDGIIFLKNPIPTESNRVTVLEHTVTESGQLQFCNTRARDREFDYTAAQAATMEPAFELPLSREQEIRKILEERIECPPEVASYIAPECLSACLQKGFDPITVMNDLALAWRISRHEPGMPPIARIGTWIMRKIHHWRDPSLPYGAPSSDAPRRAETPDWAELRRRIIAGAVEGGEVRGADLRDYWDHQMAVGKLHCLDSQISHAIAALERAGCCHRHGNALSITSEVLRIEPGQRHKVSKAQGMERLQRAVQRRWPNIGDQWQAIVDEILCNLKWWRGMLGEGLNGLADWIDSDAGQNKDRDDRIEYQARIKGVRFASEPPKKRELVNELPISSIRNDEIELTHQETLFLESEKRRLAQVN